MYSYFFRPIAGLLLFAISGFVSTQAETLLPLGKVEFRQDAPSRYTVIDGDNLLDVMGVFIRNAWQYLEALEKKKISLRPGDVVIRRGNQLLMGANRTIKLSPNIRITRLQPAIDVIPIDKIRQFLIQPMILEAEELIDSAYVLSNSNGKVLLGTGDVFYARGIEAEIEDENKLGFTIMRPGQVYTDSETGAALAYEAVYLGEAILQKAGDPATLQVKNVTQEIRAGDRLLLTEKRNLAKDLYPHIPDDIIEDGEIIAVVNGVSQIGQYQVVVINKGYQDYLERGHILGIFRGGELIRDRFNNNELVKLPNTLAGSLLLFKIFEKVSFGLVTKASQTIYVRDKIGLPY